MKKMNLKQFVCGLASTIFIASCSSSDNNTPVPDPVADFTSAVDGSDARIIHFTNTSTNAAVFAWDFGDGTTSTEKDPVHTFAKGGAYAIKLTASTDKGKTSDKSDWAVSTANLIGGGDMEVGNKSFWTIDTLNAPKPTSWSFTDGALKFWNETSNTETNILAFQTIHVEGGKPYTFSAHVKGGGATNMWFEIYFGTSAPIKAADYTDNKFIALNTWSGCGDNTVDGDIAVIGCDGSGKDAAGTITFAATGTVYFGIKTGVWDGAYINAVGIDDISLLKK